MNESFGILSETMNELIKLGYSYNFNITRANGVCS